MPCKQTFATPLVDDLYVMLATLRGASLYSVREKQVVSEGYLRKASRPMKINVAASARPPQARRVVDSKGGWQLAGCLARLWRTGASLGQGRRHERTGKSIGKSGCHPYRRRRIVDISANVARHFHGRDNRREFVMWNILRGIPGAYRDKGRIHGEERKREIICLLGSRLSTISRISVTSGLFSSCWN